MSKALIDKRVYFKWMDAYWSCSVARLNELNKAIEQGEPFDMEGCYQLKQEPRYHYEHLRDVDPRNEGPAR